MLSTATPVAPVRNRYETVWSAGSVYVVFSGTEMVLFVRPLPAPPCDASMVTWADCANAETARPQVAMTKDVSSMLGSD